MSDFFKCVLEKPKMVNIKFEESRVRILGCPLTGFVNLASIDLQEIFFIFKKMVTGVTNFKSIRL
jgi:hypothetical protein